jgi:hypothetical protein
MIYTPKTALTGEIIMLDFERKLELLFEAQKLADTINFDRFNDRVCSDEVTIRLCEILDILEDDMTGGLR